MSLYAANVSDISPTLLKSMHLFKEDFEEQLTHLLPNILICYPSNSNTTYGGTMKKTKKLCKH